MRSDALTFFATKTAAFDAVHEEFGRLSAPLDAWVDHLKNTVLPAYGIAYQEQFYADASTMADIEFAARALKKVYESRVSK